MTHSPSASQGTTRQYPRLHRLGLDPHLALGVLLIAAGAGVFSGQIWARTVGATLALLSAIVTSAFIPTYPVWSLAVLALDVVVVYGLIAHGFPSCATRRV